MQITISTLLVLTLLWLPGAVGAQSQTQAMQFDFPIDQIQYDQCTNESVHVTGQGHGVMHFFFDSSGGFHATDIMTTMGPLSGVGIPSGNLYKANETVINTSNLKSPQFEFTFVMSEVLISQGPAPNLVSHTTTHFTVTPSGIPTANVLNMKTECSG